MTYKLIVKGYNSGLNELLDAQNKRYDSRLKRTIVFNAVKKKNDTICLNAIRKSDLRKVKITDPVQITYKFYPKDKKHDRSNYASAFVKSFEDALQQCKVIQNDTYDLVLTPEYYFEVDRENPRVEVIIREVQK